MKRISITCIMKKRRVVILLVAIMLCIVGTNCLTGASAKQNLIREKKVLERQDANVPGVNDKSYYVYANSTGSLGIDFQSNGSKVTAITANDKNIHVELAHQCDSDFEIEYLVRKAGNYTIVVTIKTKSGKTINENIELIAETYPIKKAKYANERIATSGVHYTQIKTGKFSLKMKKGYILKKIQLGVKKKGEKIVYKRIKNKSKISLGKLYKLYSGSAVIKITYISSDSIKKKSIYFHIYKI